MNCKVIIQVREDTGERHVAFSCSPIDTFEDLILTAPGWEDAKLHTETVVIVASDTVCDLLSVSEFHTIPDGIGIDLTDEQQACIGDVLRAHYEKKHL